MVTTFDTVESYVVVTIQVKFQKPLRQYFSEHGTVYLERGSNF